VDVNWDIFSTSAPTLPKNLLAILKTMGYWQFLLQLAPILGHEGKNQYNAVYSTKQCNATTKENKNKMLQFNCSTS